MSDILNFNWTPYGSCIFNLYIFFIFVMFNCPLELTNIKKLFIISAFIEENALLYDVNKIFFYLVKISSFEEESDSVKR